MSNKNFMILLGIFKLNIKTSIFLPFIGFFSVRKKWFSAFKELSKYKGDKTACILNMRFQVKYWMYTLIIGRVLISIISIFFFNISWFIYRYNFSKINAYITIKNVDKNQTTIVKLGNNQNIR